MLSRTFQLPYTLLLSTCLVAVVGCGGDDDADTDSGTSGTETEADTDPSAGPTSDSDAETETDSDTAATDTEGVTVSFDVRESVEQLHITHTTPGTELVLYGPQGEEVARANSDDLGSLIFREVTPGDGYTIEAPDLDEVTGPLRVMSVENSLPDQSFYDGQQLQPGFGYIETRDGTKLSVYVTLPGPIEDGPYPTVINYSGYEPSRPGAPLDMELPDPFTLETLCLDFPILCDVPNHPSGLIAGLMGYATVGVNMRGTGCSGGAYDFFETLQTLDGYDIVETVAAQDWVFKHHVGLVGLSYPGLSQLWVAKTQPPSLAAITPLSVIADTVTSTLAPGGIFNDGFALNWAENVLDGADPYGQGWEQGQVDAGDDTCSENQLLHRQKVDTVKKAEMYPFYVDEVADPLNPSKFAGEIEVPVFVAGGWQDEQTGGHFPALFDKFSNAPLKRFTAYNGIHQDGYQPELLVEWKNFLDFHVALQVPEIDPVLRTLAPLLIESVFGAAVEFPPDRFAMFSSFDEAYATYIEEPDLKVMFDVGNSAEYGPGVPASSFWLEFEQWPLQETEPMRWFLQPDGSLGEAMPPTDGGASAFLHDPEAGRTLNVTSGINNVIPNWNWIQDEPGTAAVFLTEPLGEDLVMLGSASADLWIRSSANEADLEVTISEVRPDGQEMYVQSGWLRASHRKLAADATPLRPIKTHLESDWQPLTPGEWVEARVEIFPFGHVFRSGSRVRIAIDTPGETRAEWKFILTDYGDDEVVHDVGHSETYPSSVLLPILPDVEVPAELPPCPSLRGQPCHEFIDYTNTPSE